MLPSHDVVMWHIFAVTQDRAGLKRFLDRENARELPANEEPWEVPAPVEVKAETIGKHLSVSLN